MYSCTYYLHTQYTEYTCTHVHIIYIHSTLLMSALVLNVLHMYNTIYVLFMYIYLPDAGTHVHIPLKVISYITAPPSTSQVS